MTKIKPIHPFPARMASEIALEAFESISDESIVLDPMAGSGTVLRMAAEHGHEAIGFDKDPMSVLLAKVWTTPIDPERLRTAADETLEQAQELDSQNVSLDWIDDDQETREFIDFWFVEPQKDDLRRLAYVLHNMDGPINDALRVAMSRLIITKKKGASIAGDVSHSRPHRIRETNDFDVPREFIKSANWLADRLGSQTPPGRVSVSKGDARNLCLDDASVDAIVTSPPYLNAIDYLRGHRMALVWLGHQIEALRVTRADLVGAERMLDSDADQKLAKKLTASVGELEELPSRKQGMIHRYALDMHATMLEMHRVLKDGGKAVLVIGNSHHRGVFVRNTESVKAAAEKAGFKLEGTSQREIPPSRRYLPPPSQLSESDLKKRMRTETVFTFLKEEV